MGKNSYSSVIKTLMLYSFNLDTLTLLFGVFDFPLGYTYVSTIVVHCTG